MYLDPIRISKMKVKIRNGLSLQLSRHVLLLILCSCASSPSSQSQSSEPKENLFFSPFEKVWQAANSALQNWAEQKYRFMSNLDEGIIETNFIGEGDAWHPPFRERSELSGRRYKIRIQLVRGNYGDREAVKVIVSKQAYLKRNFFSEMENETSDGMEEIAILYRIGRELLIQKALERLRKDETSPPVS